MDPDAAGVAARLAPLLADAADVSVTPAPSAVAARAYLAGAAFDAVAVRDAADAAALQALAGVLGQPLTVHVYADEAGLAEWLRARLGPPAATASGASPPVATDAARAVLEEVQQELARLTHALNNPLAVVAGNAQLGREMALATGADAEVVDALDGVDAAAAALGALFDEIGALRARIGRALEGDALR